MKSYKKCTPCVRSPMKLSRVKCSRRDNHIQRAQRSFTTLNMTVSSYPQSTLSNHYGISNTKSNSLSPVYENDSLTPCQRFHIVSRSPDSTPSLSDPSMVAIEPLCSLCTSCAGAKPADLDDLSDHGDDVNKCVDNPLGVMPDLMCSVVVGGVGGTGRRCASCMVEREQHSVGR